MENQLSRYGAISKALEHLGPQGKLFFLAPSAATWLGDFMNVFPNDSYGVPRVATTLASAMTGCVANRGDVIVALPGYTETLTAVCSVAKAGVSIVGVGQGNLRPTITVNAAVDGISLDAASTRLQGFNFAAPETDSATAMVNITAAGCAVKDIRGIGSKTSKNFIDCITVATGADDLTIDGVQLFNTTVPVNSFLSIEAAVARLVVKNFYAFGDCVTAGIIDAATATQILLQDVTIGTVGTTIPGAILDSNPTGMAVRCNFAGTSTTLANNAALGTGLRLFDVKVLEETDGSKQGALIPAVDVD